jgi:pimeloyl-ACP methyl ester carboxylesterase
VVIVPGWCSPMGLEWQISLLPGEFKSQGYDVEIFRPLGYGTIDIETNAQRLLDFCHKLDELQIYKAIHIVAHSMGGLVARYADQMSAGYCNSIATLGTPHYGAPLAWLAGWSHAAQQMRPSSGFLRRLNGTPAVVPMLSIGGRLDTVVPLKKSIVSNGPSRKVYHSHVSMLFDRRIAKELLSWFELQENSEYHN